MHQLSTLHRVTTKHLLCYLKGRLHYYLFSHQNTPISLHAYSDVDYVSDMDDQTSITTYVVYLGANPISSSSKK